MPAPPHTESRTRVRTALILVVFLMMAIVMYEPVLFRSEPLDYFGMVDTSLLLGPALYFGDHSVHVDGGFPQWNPLILCGTPFAANPESLLFYPPNLLRTMLNPYPTPLRTMISCTIFIWLHIVLAGLGSFFLARSHRLSLPGALIAAMTVAFSFCSMQTAQINPYFLLTASWIPLLLLMTRTALISSNRARRTKYALLGGATFALLTLSGFTPYLPVVAAGTALYSVVHCACSKPMPRTAHSIYGGVARAALLITTILLVGSALSAALLLPAAEFSKASTRHSGSPVHVDVRKPGAEMAPTPLLIFQRIVFYAPYARGYRPFGAGAGIAILCALATWHARRREALPYLALLYLLIDCAIGPPMPIAWLLVQVTPFQLSNPDYIAVLAPIPLGVLAAFGIDSLADAPGSPKASRHKTLFAAGATLFILIGMVDAATAPPLLPDFAALDEMMDTGSDVVMPASAMCSALAAACAICLAIPSRFRSQLIAAALVAVFLEMYLASRDVVPFPPERAKTFIIPEIVKSVAREDRTGTLWRDNERFNSPNWNAIEYRLEATSTGYDPLHLLSTYRLLSDTNYRSGRDVRFVPDEVPDYTYPCLRRAFWLARDINVAPLPPVDHPYPSATTVFLSTPPPIPFSDASSIEEMGSYVSKSQLRTPMSVRDSSASANLPAGSQILIEKEIPIERPRPLFSVLKFSVRAARPVKVKAMATHINGARYEILGQRKADPTEEGKVNVYFPLPDWDRMTVTLSMLNDQSANIEIVDPELIQDMEDEGGMIEVVKRTADTVHVRAQCAGNRILLFTDAAYPGWRASVDGKPQAILSANDAFKAVALPAGQHDIVFEFKSNTVRIGATISLTTLAIISALIAILHYARPRRSAHARP